MNHIGWIRATTRLNWANMTANGGAFWSMAALMAVQNLIYFGLWVVVFSRIPSLAGWGLREVAFLFSSGAFGYGLFFTVFGGLNQLSDHIHDGVLDMYLARPRPVLPGILMHRMRADSLGDIITGIVMLVLFIRPAASDLPLILILSLLSGVVYTAFRLIMHSLAFWGTGNQANENGFVAFLIASTNPQNGVGPWGKAALLSVFPAGYIAFLPVEILRRFDPWMMAWQVAGTAGVAGFSIWLFHRGLRRYASGNMFITLR